MRRNQKIITTVLWSFLVLTMIAVVGMGMWVPPQVRKNDAWPESFALAFRRGREARRTTDFTAIEAEVAVRHGGVRVAIAHRLGRLAPGAISVAIAAAGPHRRETLQACGETLEAVKGRAPIWKREIYRDGTVWIEAGGAVPAARQATVARTPAR